MTYIRGLIKLPERVHKGDFVLRLTEGIDRADDTLRDYVVTKQLVGCFDNAMGFIKGALDSKSSKAAYLHGSFGSGKSHFMAVLHLLLKNNPEARSIPELAACISKHNSWTEGKKFLLVPYHMIGARNMESAILGGYADYVQHNIPDAPLPGVYLAEEIFKNAEQFRDDMGDEKFFQRLNGDGGGGGGGWGTFESSWDAESFEAAIKAAPKAENRSRLVGDLVANILPAVQGVATGQDEAYVSLDEGLSIVSRHAKSLEYDAVILFLDELVLWLASRAADVGFVHREGQKLAKLVEAQSADRPIPIVSFVARQRDLRELVGDNITGAEQLSFSDALKHWEGRFHTITLEDRNLPAIAEKRVLKPESESARQQLDNAFKETEKIRQAVMDVLLTSEADKGMFRQVYPFSPALVQTLVAVSSLLQRERTALKVMMQLLVDQRDHLLLGDIVPVGDLFDVIAHGDEAFSDVMQRQFENAKKLYHEKLLPMLERQHSIRMEEIQDLPWDDPRVTAFRNDDRLLKTLLLSALAPEVEALKDLRPNRLAALNHGTIKSPIPGREGGLVLSKVRTWAAQVGEIKIGDEPTNPTISLQLHGVDTDSIIEQAQGEDNPGNRRRKIREILFKELGLQDSSGLFVNHEFAWNGTKRFCSVMYENVRLLVDESLHNTDEDWKVIIDFPFDPEGRSPKDDIARIEEYRKDHPGGGRTLAWLPTFLSASAQKELGTLVILDHILAGENYDRYSTHLSVVDRASAKTLLENQCSVLTQRIRSYLEGAYGVATAIPGSLDESHGLADHFVALDPGFEPRPPVGANLSQAFEHLLGQALEHQFPAHPKFETDTRTANLRKVYAEVQKAIQAPDGRLLVEKPLRPLLRQIANPLKLGNMTETHFVLGHNWKTHFTKKIAENPGPVTVSKLREWFDEPRPMGLPKQVQNLVIMLFADQTDRSFFMHGGPWDDPSIEQLPGEVELREQKLPAEDEWKIAVERAGAILGIAVSQLLSARNVARLASEADSIAKKYRADCEKLVRRLMDIMPQFGVDPKTAHRTQTAGASLAFVEAMCNAADDQIVTVIAKADVPTTEAAMGSSIKKAASILEILEATSWDLFEGVRKLEDERKSAAEAIIRDVSSALEKDEHAVALGHALADAQKRAVRLLTNIQTPPSNVPAVPPASAGTTMVVGEGADSGLEPQRARKVIESIVREIGDNEDVRLDITWKIYKKESSK